MALSYVCDPCISQKNVGVFISDKNYGPVVDEWNACSESGSYQFNTVDVTIGVYSILAVKDEDERVIILVR